MVGFSGYLTQLDFKFAIYFISVTVIKNLKKVCSISFYRKEVKSDEKCDLSAGLTKSLLAHAVRRIFQGNVSRTDSLIKRKHPGLDTNPVQV